MQPILFPHPEFRGYDLLDSGAGEKLERFGDVVLRRPDPQALWRPRLAPAEWERDLQRVLALVHTAHSACTVDDLLTRADTLSSGMGRSRRTLQNDLRKLAEMGYLSWQKRGSARTYALTPRGLEIVSA